MTPAQYAEFEAAVAAYDLAVTDIAERSNKAFASLWSGFVAWNSAAAVAAQSAQSAALSRGFQDVTAAAAREFIVRLLKAYPGNRRVGRVPLQPVRGGIDLARVHERIVDERLLRQAMSGTPEVFDRGAGFAPRGRATPALDPSPAEDDDQPFADLADPDTDRNLADPDEAAQARMRNVVDGDLMLVRRQVERDAMASAGITLYRRIIRPELSRTGTCGLCVVASDRIYRIKNLLPLHGFCKCGVAPVLPGEDPAAEMNLIDIDAFYEAAGGTDAASLSRVRVKTIQHGEMGPMLVPGGQRKKSRPAATRQQLVEYTPESAAKVIPSTQRHIDYLLAREAAGEDVSKGLAYNLDLLRRLEDAARG